MQTLGRQTEAYNNKKDKNQSICDQISFGIQFKCFRKSATRENFNLKPETRTKETHSKNRGNHIRHYKGVKREAVASFLHLCLDKICAQGQRYVCI